MFFISQSPKKSQPESQSGCQSSETDSLSFTIAGHSEKLIKCNELLQTYEFVIAYKIQLT